MRRVGHGLSTLLSFASFCLAPTIGPEASWEKAAGSKCAITVIRQVKSENGPVKSASRRAENVRGMFHVKQRKGAAGRGLAPLRLSS
jgi:hypothetical protein